MQKRAALARQLVEFPQVKSGMVSGARGTVQILRAAPGAPQLTEDQWTYLEEKYIEELLPEFAGIYAEAMTAEQLQHLIDFYTHSLGLGVMQALEAMTPAFQALGQKHAAQFVKRAEGLAEAG